MKRIAFLLILVAGLALPFGCASTGGASNACSNGCSNSCDDGKTDDNACNPCDDW